MTETIDYDKLNEAASAVWDTAYKRGKNDGIQEHTHEEADYRRKSNLDLAKHMLSAAIQLYDERSDVTDPWACERMAVYARMLLSRTPLCTPIDQALRHLKWPTSASSRGDWPDVQRLKEALQVVTEGLDAMGGY